MEIPDVRNSEGKTCQQSISDSVVFIYTIFGKLEYKLN